MTSKALLNGQSAYTAGFPTTETYSGKTIKENMVSKKLKSTNKKLSGERKLFSTAVCVCVRVHTRARIKAVQSQLFPLPHY